MVTANSANKIVAPIVAPNAGSSIVTPITVTQPGPHQQGPQQTLQHGQSQVVPMRQSQVVPMRRHSTHLMTQSGEVLEVFEDQGNNAAVAMEIYPAGTDQENLTLTLGAIAALELEVKNLANKIENGTPKSISETINDTSKKVTEMAKLLKHSFQEVAILRNADKDHKKTIVNLNLEIKNLNQHTNDQTTKMDKALKELEEQNKTIKTLSNLSHNQVELSKKLENAIAAVDKNIQANSKLTESAHRHVKSVNSFVHDKCHVIKAPSRAELEVVAEMAIHAALKDVWQGFMNQKWLSNQQVQLLAILLRNIAERRNVLLQFLDHEGSIVLEPDSSATVVEFISWKDRNSREMRVEHIQRAMQMSFSSVMGAIFGGGRIGCASEDAACDRCQIISFLEPSRESIEKGASEEEQRESRRPKPKMNHLCDDCLPKCINCADLVRGLKKILDHISITKAISEKIAATKILEKAICTPLAQLLDDIEAFDPAKLVTGEAQKLLFDQDEIELHVLREDRAFIESRSKNPRGTKGAPKEYVPPHVATGPAPADYVPTPTPSSSQEGRGRHYSTEQESRESSEERSRFNKRKAEGPDRQSLALSDSAEYVWRNEDRSRERSQERSQEQSTNKKAKRLGRRDEAEREKAVQEAREIAHCPPARSPILPPENSPGERDHPGRGRGTILDGKCTESPKGLIQGKILTKGFLKVPMKEVMKPPVGIGLIILRIIIIRRLMRITMMPLQPSSPMGITIGDLLGESKVLKAEEEVRKSLSTRKCPKGQFQK